MITDPDRFKQDRSPYERPNFPFRCGRIGLWSKPCGRGPSSEGTCGGIAECRPFFDNGRWSCRRSTRSGGPCEEGPRPDGVCSHQHPPCKPIISLRGYRGRLTFLAAALVIVVLVVVVIFIIFIVIIIFIVVIVVMIVVAAVSVLVAFALDRE